MSLAKAAVLERLWLLAPKCRETSIRLCRTTDCCCWAGIVTAIETVEAMPDE